MTHSNNDIEQLEELLTELEGQEARIITPYSEEDDAVTRLMDAPLGDQDWMVQVTALDRRMMSTSQVLSELAAGKISARTLVWRGGMDDWLPLARVEELSRASSPPASMSRPAYNFAPPPPPPAPAAPRSQPMWASPPSAPLPPPPVAMAPPIGMAPAPSMLNGLPAQSGMRSSSVGSVPTPPPAAQMPSFNAQLGVPVSAPMPEVPSFSSGNTARPVAVDFSDLPEANAPLQSKRWVMALSAVAILAVFVTVYSLSSGGDESDAPVAAATSSSAKPSSAAQPASAPAEKASAAASAPRPEPVAAAPAAASEEEEQEDQAEANDDDDSASRGRSRARQNVPARYSARSELRRRSRGSSARSQSDAEERRAPVALAAVATRPAAPEASEEQEPASEPAAAVADEVDEPPRSTSKGSTFDREAAKAALDDAASQAKNCRPAGGPSGSGRVQIRYEPSGKVANVTILTSKFDNTTTGSCVRMLFRRAKVPEFTGAPAVVVNKSFEIP